MNETSWMFGWTAPTITITAGPITLNLAVVDGNGANSDTTKAVTDLLGDDLALLEYTLIDADERAVGVETVRGGFEMTKV